MDDEPPVTDEPPVNDGTELWCGSMDVWEPTGCMSKSDIEQYALESCGASGAELTEVKLHGACEATADGEETYQLGEYTCCVTQ